MPVRNKKSWEDGVKSIVAEVTREVIYGERGKTDLHMFLDMLRDNDPILNEKWNVAPRAVKREEQNIPYESLRRFHQISHNRKTGRSNFSLMGEERMSSLTALLRDLGVLFKVMIAPHTMPVDTAMRLSRINRYDLDGGDASLMASQLRGMFIAQHEVEGATIESLVVINFIPPEETFLVREFRFIYKHYNEDHTTDLRERLRDARPHKRIVRDGFCKAGPTKGRIFSLEDRKNLPSNYPFGSFVFDEGGKRIISFTVASPFDRSDQMTYRLCNTEKDLNRATKILAALDGLDGKTPELVPAWA